MTTRPTKTATEPPAPRLVVDDPTDAQLDAACFALADELQLSRDQVRRIWRAIVSTDP